MEAANLPVFLVFENAKNSKYLFFFAKITFNNSHLGTIKCGQREIITVKIFPWGQLGVGQ